jgi:hypothetical protein
MRETRSQASKELTGGCNPADRPGLLPSSPVGHPGMHLKPSIETASTKGMTAYVHL